MILLYLFVCYVDYFAVFDFLFLVLITFAHFIFCGSFCTGCLRTGCKLTDSKVVWMTGGLNVRWVGLLAWQIVCLFDQMDCSLADCHVMS